MVAVPNNFTRNQLEVRFRTAIESALAAFFGRSVQLAVIVDETSGHAAGGRRRTSTEASTTMRLDQPGLRDDDGPSPRWAATTGRAGGSPGR